MLNWSFWFQASSPDREEAARAAHDELQRAIYQEHQNLLTNGIYEILIRITKLFDHVGPGVSLNRTILIIATLILILVIVGLLVRPLTETLAGRRSISSTVFDDDRSAQQLDAAADAAALAEDWPTALVERFRALVRSLDEADIIVDSPGLTAREAMLSAAIPAPHIKTELLAAGKLFDDVRYGRYTAQKADHDRIVGLRAQVIAAKNSLVGGAP